MGKASSPSSGFNASNFMYGFIFLMYAVVACVLFWLMANRWVSSGWPTSHLTPQANNNLITAGENGGRTGRNRRGSRSNLTRRWRRLMLVLIAWLRGRKLRLAREELWRETVIRRMLM